MSDICWRFPPLFGGNQQGYSSGDIESFKGQDLIDNLAREICQNSLDARISNSGAPVKVVFELRSLDARLDVFTQYKGCLDGCRSYWGDQMDSNLSKFVSNAEQMLEKEKIPVLVISDYNTRGLEGCNEPTTKVSSPWAALTGSDGVSVKNDENSAGSFGIGKNAPFACSTLSMVFYNTLCGNSESAFIGVARLATINNKDGKPTQRVGKYQVNDDENESWIPIYPATENKLRDDFIRTQQGTDVIIMGFNQCEHWVENVTKAVLLNFFVAISEGLLIVELKEGSESKRNINAENISQLISDFANNPKDTKVKNLAQLYEAFTRGTKNYLTIMEPNDVEYYIKTDSQYKNNVAFVRTAGMLLYNQKKRGVLNFAAVVIVRGSELGKLLKEAEPPRHDQWEYKRISDDECKRKKIKGYIQKINDKLKDLIQNLLGNKDSESVDVAWVSEYLPDEYDDYKGDARGGDVLRPKIKIAEIRPKAPKSETSIQRGKQGTGVSDEGIVHNHEKNPEAVSQNTQPKCVNPDIDNPSTEQGVIKGDGTKTIIKPVDIEVQRAVQVNPAEGLYKIIIKPLKTSNSVFFECCAVEEDGRSDPKPLDLESFTTDNGVKVKCLNGKAGPVAVKSKRHSVFYARFVNKEKMILSLSITEEIKK